MTDSTISKAPPLSDFSSATPSLIVSSSLDGYNSPNPNEPSVNAAFLVDSGAGSYTVSFPYIVSVPAAVRHNCPGAIRGLTNVMIELYALSLLQGTNATNLWQSGTYAIVIRSRKHLPFATATDSTIVSIVAAGGLKFYPGLSDPTTSGIYTSCNLTALVLGPGSYYTAGSPNFMEYTAGSTVSFCVQSKDRFGNLAIWEVATGADPITVSLVRPSGGTNSTISGSLVDNENGNYTVSFEQTIAGDYRLYIYLAGVALTGPDASGVGLLPLDPNGAPYIPVRIDPGPISIPSCTAHLLGGVYPSALTPKAGALITLYVQEVDSYGNDRSQFTQVSPGVPLYFNVTFTDVNDPTRTWSILGGSSTPVTSLGIVVDSVFQSSSLTNQTISVSSLGTSSASSLYVGYTIDLLYDPGRHPIQYLAGGPKAPDLLSGNYSLSITADGYNISGSPFNLSVVAGDLSLNNTLVYGQGVAYSVNYTALTGGTTVEDAAPTIRSGDPVSFTLLPRDRYNNTILGSNYSWSGYITPLGSGRPSIAFFVLNTTDGTYDGTYTPLSTGNFTLHLALGASFIPTVNFLTGYPTANSSLTIMPVNPVDGSTLQDGTAIQVGPGALNSSNCFAQDIDKNAQIVKGSYRVGTLAANSTLQWEIQALDKFVEPKLNQDSDRYLSARLVWVATSTNSSTLVGYPNVTTQTTPPGPTYWVKNDTSGHWYWDFGTLVRHDNSTNVYYPVDQVNPLLTIPGYYNLEVYVVDTLANTTSPIGSGLKTSPYQILVVPGTSSAGNSVLSSSSGSSTGARRKLLTSIRALDDPAYDPAEHYYEPEMTVDPVGRKARRLLQTGAPTLVSDLYTPDLTAQAGVFKTLRLQLKDSLGNLMVFDPTRPLDRLNVKIGEAVAPGNTTCSWTNGTKSFYAPYLDLSAFAPDYKPWENCTLVWLGWSNSTGTVTPPDYSSTGINLVIYNDYTSGAFDISFTLDKQFPATPYSFYLMEVLLNDVPITGSPFTLRVDPGPPYGPNCELGNGTVLNTTVGDVYSLNFTARDALGNQHYISDIPDNFVAEMSLVTPLGTEIRGCTLNSMFSTDCFRLTVTGDDSNTITGGLYEMSFQTTISSLPPDVTTGSTTPRDFSFTLRYCGPGEHCSIYNNFYNPSVTPQYTPAGTVFYDGFSFHVEPGPISSVRTTIVGAAINYGGLAGPGLNASFTIETRDQFGNRRLSGGEASLISAFILTPSYSGSVPPLDNNDGTYTVTFPTENVGVYNIFVQVDSIEVQGSPASVTFRSVLDDGYIVPGSSRLITIFGDQQQTFPTVTAGGNLSLLIQACSLGPSPTFALQYKGQGGDLVVATLKDTLGGSRALDVNLTVLDSSNTVEPIYGSSVAIPGRYTLHVNGSQYLTKASTYSLTIAACRAQDPGDPIGNRSCVPGTTLQNIDGSPFPLRVQSGTPLAKASYAVELTDPALYANNGAGWSAGPVLYFTIRMKDIYGNDYQYDAVNSPTIADNLDIVIESLDEPGYTLQRITISSPSQVTNGTFDILPNLSGVFVVYFRTYKAHLYRFTMSLGGDALLNSGATAQVYPGTLSPSNSILEGDITSVTAGDPLTFTIWARDAYGNQFVKGGVDFHITLTALQSFTANGFGDNPLYAQAKIINETAVDSAGNVINLYNYDGSWNYRVSTSQYVTARATLVTQDNGDGSYTVTAVMQKAGQSNLLITSQVTDSSGSVVNEQICGTTDAAAICSASGTLTSSGFTINVEPGDPSTSTTVVSSSTNGLTTSVAGQVNTLTLTAYDQYNNPQNSSSYSWIIFAEHRDPTTGQVDRTVTGSYQYVYANDPRISSLGYTAGSYAITIQPVVALTYSLNIKLGSVNVQGAFNNGSRIQGPWPFTVVPGATSALLSVINHQVTSNRTGIYNSAPHPMLSALAGQEAVFTIQTYDAQNNSRTSGGDSFFLQVGISEQGSCSDNGDGSYTCKYIYYTAGDIYIRVSLNRVPLQLVLVNGIESSLVYLSSREALDTYVFPNAVDPANSVFATPGTVTGGVQGIAGQSIEVTILAKDQYFNPRLENLDSFTAILSKRRLVNGTITPEVVSTVTATADGVTGTTALYIGLTETGYFSVVVECASCGNNAVIYNSSAVTAPEPVITPTALAVSNVLADGDGIGTTGVALAVKDPTYFMVYPKDRYGNNLTTLTNQFGVTAQTRFGGTYAGYTIASATVVTTEILWPASGSADQAYFNATEIDSLQPIIQLMANYTPPVGGSYVVGVTFDGKHIIGSPYELVIAPGPVGGKVPTGSTASVHGCTLSTNFCSSFTGQQRIMSGGSAQFDIVIRDIYGSR